MNQRKTIELPIRVVVVDDEAPARANITTLLRNEPETEVVGEYAGGFDALRAIPKLRPHVLFVDVQMPECDGFDLIEMLGHDIPPAVVFVTAHDEYAVKAFEIQALDYLLKPFDDARFLKALGRAKERVKAQLNAPAPHDLLISKSAGRVVFVKACEVDWIEGADYYSCLHVGAQSHLIRRTMKDLERGLDTSRFCRIHRSTIVNLDRVQEVVFGSGGEHEVLLKDRTTLPLSRKYRPLLKSRLFGMSAISRSEVADVPKR